MSWILQPKARCVDSPNNNRSKSEQLVQYTLDCRHTVKINMKLFYRNAWFCCCPEVFDSFLMIIHQFASLASLRFVPPFFFVVFCFVYIVSFVLLACSHANRFICARLCQRILWNCITVASMCTTHAYQLIHTQTRTRIFMHKFVFVVGAFRFQCRCRSIHTSE